ncbi:uncharacterized protein LOC129758267 isoform X2 [Uranotaenia lowii]|uniref:uncharacterized protein LOC129758267 isoform X2 n=1 Tax=Uranotaenia lowii TaxID=190385 RepID=UPI002478D0F5|nr:uncharacterized protein LOC129758267 isoform X2 [Uranotaenia lowii]
MAMFGSIDPYVPGTSFANYVERLEYFFSSNNIAELKRKDLFLSFCGMVVFDEIKLLFPAIDLKTLTYEEITKKLKERYDKTDSELQAYVRFRNRKQAPSESNENYILAVKLLAEACEFDGYRDRAIRNQLVIGIQDKELRKRLFNEENLTLKTAERMIKNSERFFDNDRFIDTENINSVKYRLGDRQSRMDSRFSGRRFSGGERSRSRENNRHYNKPYDYNRNRSKSRNHQNGRSRYANFKCNFCGEMGHVWKSCFERKRSQRNYVNLVDEKPKEQKEVHDYFKRLRVDYTSSDDSGEYLCMMIKSINNISEPCLLNVQVGDKILKMEVDSGSAVSVISKTDYILKFKHFLVEKK